MQAKRYRAVFRGELLPRQDPELVKRRMAELYSTDIEEIEQLFRKVPVVLKGGLSQERAEVLRSGLEFVGAVVVIEEDPVGGSAAAKASAPAVHEMETPRTAVFRELGLVVCPKCGFEQPLSEACESCGIVFAKLDRPPYRKHAGSDGASSVEDVAAARAAACPPSEQSTDATGRTVPKPGAFPWEWMAAAVVFVTVGAAGLLMISRLVVAEDASAVALATTLVLTPLTLLGALWVGGRTAFPSTAQTAARLVGLTVAAAALLCLSAFAAVVIGWAS